MLLMTYARPEKPRRRSVPPERSAVPSRTTRLLAVEHPEVVVTPWYRLGFLLTSMVAGLSSVAIKQLLLPIQVGLLAPTTTNTAFALVSSMGALAGLLAAPLTGALSDRTVSRWGRRRPWLLAGILVGVAGLLLMAVARTIPWLLLGEILEQIGVDTVLSTVTALIPDQIPPPQRPGLAALCGMAPVVGGVLGLVGITLLTNPRVVAQGYLVLAVGSLLCTGFFVLVLRERPCHAQPSHRGIRGYFYAALCVRLPRAILSAPCSPGCWLFSPLLCWDRICSSPCRCVGIWQWWKQHAP